MTKLAERITITLGADSIELRPSLRFAIRLERRPGSFAALVQAIPDGSLTAACDILGDHVTMSAHMQDAVFNVLSDLRDPLLTYVMACAGIDPEDLPANDNGKSDTVSVSRKTVPFSEHRAALDRRGSGGLGWTPADTLDATPAEITEAYKGRLDMLKSIFGGGEEAPAKPSGISLDDKFKTAFGSFGTTKVQRKKAG